MIKNSNIRYLKNKEIEFIKWDNVIAGSENSLIYTHSYYLDMVSPKWDALVYKDYEYVMPLTVKKKLGYSFLIQPTYCQQLGIFPNPDVEITQEFIDAIKRQFKYVSINFNSYNKIPEVLENEITYIQNYILDLSLPYDQVALSYSSHTKRHVKKTYHYNLKIEESLRPSVFLTFKKNNQDPGIYKKSIQILEKMLPELLSRDKVRIYGVYDKNDELCAAGIFIFDRYRIIYLNGVSSRKGKELDAMYFLLNAIIQRNSGSKFYFDFEGSRIPGVARFFEGFGAVKEYYYNFKYNNLPVPLRWIKR
jgi:hypothetical protein